MKGVNPSASQSLEIRENWRTVNEALGELYFVPVLRLPMGTLSGTAVQVFVGAIPGILLPNAGIGATRWTEPRRPRWQRAGVRIRVWYTCGVGAVANFVLNVEVLPHSAGDVLTAVAGTLGANLVMPGPAVANTEMLAEYVTTTTTVVAGNKDLLTWRFLRDPAHASDLNVNDLILTGVRIEILPQL